MSKAKAIIFGASEGGKNFNLQQNEYNIVAFVDNDQDKWGSTIEEIKVVSPYKILNMDYDFIIIASMFYKSIFDQLKMLGIEENKIVLPSKNKLKKSIRPFQDKCTLEFAKIEFKRLISCFQLYDVNYFLSAGTLLGFVREGDFISWDDDIDFVVHPDSITGTLDSIKEFVSNYKGEVEWNIFVSKDNNNFIHNVDLNFNSKKFLPFTININILTFKEDLAWEIYNYSPKYLYEDFDYIQYEGVKLRVPIDYIKYLEYTYGDWREPHENSSFLNNSKTFLGAPNIQIFKEQL